MYLQFYVAHQLNSIQYFVLAVAKHFKLNAFAKMISGLKLAFDGQPAVFPHHSGLCPQSFDWCNQSFTFLCCYASRHLEASWEFYLYWSTLQLSTPAKCNHSMNNLVSIWDYPWRKYYNYCSTPFVSRPTSGWGSWVNIHELSYVFFYVTIYS